MGFQNPSLFWSPCQPRWAKRYTAETPCSIKQQILLLKTSQFVNYYRSRINRIKQQKLALLLANAHSTIRYATASQVDQLIAARSDCLHYIEVATHIAGYVEPTGEG